MKLRAVAGMVLGVAAASQWLPSVVSLGQWAPIRALPGDWCRWRGQGPGVALTFDDGPDPESTPALLDALDHLGLVATFFCLGDHVDRWPELVADTVARGHQVATHGYSHGHHLAHSPRWILQDLDASIDALQRVGVESRWFRPPYGQVSGPTLAAARSRHVGLVLWSAWGREWVAPDADAVARRVIAGLTGGQDGGGIVLLHDSDRLSPVGSAAKALDALGPIAEEIDRRNMPARTLDALVGTGRYTLPTRYDRQRQP